jgi:hypothetical protein
MEQNIEKIKNTLVYELQTGKIYLQFFELHTKKKHFLTLNFFKTSYNEWTNLKHLVQIFFLDFVDTVIKGRTFLICLQNIFKKAMHLSVVGEM